MLAPAIALDAFRVLHYNFPMLTYAEARAAYEAAKLVKGNFDAVKAAWAAMEAAPDCPAPPKRWGYSSRAGQRQYAQRRDR